MNLYIDLKGGSGSNLATRDPPRQFRRKIVFARFASSHRPELHIPERCFNTSRPALRPHWNHNIRTDANSHCTEQGELQSHTKKERSFTERI